MCLSHWKQRGCCGFFHSNTDFPPETDHFLALSADDTAVLSSGARGPGGHEQRPHGKARDGDLVLFLEQNCAVIGNFGTELLCDRELALQNLMENGRLYRKMMAVGGQEYAV